MISHLTPSKDPAVLNSDAVPVAVPDDLQSRIIDRILSLCLEDCLERGAGGREIGTLD
jgi:hypothetical protein